MQGEDIKTEEGTLAGMPSEVIKKSPIMQAISRHAEKWEPKVVEPTKEGCQGLGIAGNTFIAEEHIPVGLDNPFW